MRRAGHLLAKVSLTFGDELGAEHPLQASGPQAAARSGNFAARTALRRVTGIHQGQDGPFGYEDRLISLDAVPEARDADFSGCSPGMWLLRSVPWTEARHRISAVGANADVSGCLSIPRNTPCLMVERWTWRAGVPVTFVSQTFRGDRFDLIATFTPEGR